GGAAGPGPAVARRGRARSGGGAAPRPCGGVLSGAVGRRWAWTPPAGDRRRAGSPGTAARVHLRRPSAAPWGPAARFAGRRGRRVADAVLSQLAHVGGWRALRRRGGAQPSAGRPPGCVQRPGRAAVRCRSAHGLYVVQPSVGELAPAPGVAPARARAPRVPSRALLGHSLSAPQPGRV